MKASGAPEVGDLVYHKYDKQRGFKCVGLVLKCSGIECSVLFASKSHPKCWVRRDQLWVINESR